MLREVAAVGKREKIALHVASTLNLLLLVGVLYCAALNTTPSLELTDPPHDVQEAPVGVPVHP
jgi:hypothetical protein